MLVVARGQFGLIALNSASPLVERQENDAHHESSSNFADRQNKRSTPAGIRTPTVGSEDQSAIHYTTGASSGIARAGPITGRPNGDSLTLPKMYTDFRRCGNQSKGHSG